MYSSVNNHERHKSILSLTEVAGIIIVFSFMLYLLFPKGDIEHILEGQGGHANLSIHYLESMVLYHPNNIELKMILMKKYTQTGKELKALALNQKLIENTNSKALLTQLYKIEYLLKKTLYFADSKATKLQELKDKLLAYYEYTKENRDNLFFLSESSSIDYSYLKYHSLEQYLKENPTQVNYELEKMAYDLATTLGYQEASYAYLEKLIQYPQLDNALSEYFIYSLFERREFTKARKVTRTFFLRSQNEDELTKFFHLALYSLVQDPTRSPTDVSQLIQDYANLKELFPLDIDIILSTLLELGDSKEAANFAVNMLYANPDNFDEVGIDLALKSLLYNAELEHAQALSFYAENKFKKEKYLDQTIQLSIWLGDTKASSALNKRGYYEYNPQKYEQYFLKNENLNFDHAVLGDIYKNKIANQQHKFTKNLALYYDHTGELDKAEAYFTTLYQKNKHQKALYYAIEFSHKNSHFEKSLKLYQAYRAKYGIDPQLHEGSIQRLLALRRFSEAYAMTKALEKKDFLDKKQRFADLAWMEKDYAYLHQKFWHFEAKNQLNPTNYEHFLLLERELNNGAKIDHLYQQAWKKTKRSYHLTSLMYKLLEAKDFKTFKNILNKLTKKEKSILNQNIDFHTLVAHYHAQHDNIALALQSYDRIFKLAPKRIASHQSYLWFLIDNRIKHPNLQKKIALHLAKLKSEPQLRERIGFASVVAAMTSKEYKLAKQWLQKLLKYNPSNKDYQSLAKDLKTIEQEKLYQHYDKTLHPEYLNAQINFKQKHLGANFSVKELDFNYQWKLYQNIKAELMVKSYDYQQAKNKSKKQNLFELAIKNSNQRFLWNLRIGQLQAKNDFISASLDLSYATHNFHVKLNSKYQNKTTLTPQLEQNALEDAMELQVTANLNRRTSFSFLTKERQFTTLDGQDVGTAKRIQLNANYILRSGYPDITLNASVSHNAFSKNIAQDFSEFGLSGSFGTARQNTLNSSWKPFGTAALAINGNGHLGTSLTLGVSKMLTGDDSLDVLFDYYNGIGVISEPTYGVNVRYRF